MVVYKRFNEILHQPEKVSATLKPYGQMEDFRQAIGSCGLSEWAFMDLKLLVTITEKDMDSLGKCWIELLAIWNGTIYSLKQVLQLLLT